MFGLGFLEILFILVLALLVLGPSKLPEAAKELGKFTAHLKKALDDLKHDVSTGDWTSSRSNLPQNFLGLDQNLDCCESPSSDEHGKLVASPLDTEIDEQALSSDSEDKLDQSEPKKAVPEPTKASENSK